MPTEPLCLTVALTVRPGCEPQAAACLLQLALHTRREPGCLVYNAHRSLADPRRFYIYELYRDEAALEAHRVAPHFAEYATAGLYPLVEDRSAELYSAVAVAPAPAPSER